MVTEILFCQKKMAQSCEFAGQILLKRGKRNYPTRRGAKKTCLATLCSLGWVSLSTQPILVSLGARSRWRQ